MKTKDVAEDLRPRKYSPPYGGLIISREPFSLELLLGEECFYEYPVLLRSGRFTKRAFMLATNFRIVVMQYRLMRQPMIFEIPRSSITSIDWDSTDNPQWISVNYETPEGCENIQLRTGNKLFRSKQPDSANQTILHQLRQVSHVLHKQTNPLSYLTPAVQTRSNRSAQILVVLFLAGSLCFMLYLFFQYPGQAQLLRVYQSSPGCSSFSASREILSSSGPCTVEQEKIVQLYLRKRRRNDTDYWAVLENESGQRETVELYLGGLFYRSARSGDAVAVQRFDEKIVQVKDGAVSSITTNHPERQVANIQTGLWASVSFLMYSVLMLLYLRVELRPGRPIPVKGFGDPNR